MGKGRKDDDDSVKKSRDQKHEMKNFFVVTLLYDNIFMDNLRGSSQFTPVTR